MNDRILKAEKRRLIIHKGSSIRNIADLSLETVKNRRQWDDIIKVRIDKINKTGNKKY